LGVVIQALRFARVCYEDSVKYAHKRKTFGKKLIDHDVIRNKLVRRQVNIDLVGAYGAQG
jgi:alkylation response protein AidB-like acyl-CoA dehydrogenase